MFMTKDEEIRKLAFDIWEQEGRPRGKDVEHYFRAKKILEEREATNLIELTPPTPVVELPPATQYAELGPTPKHIDLPKKRSNQSIRSRHKKK
jgi:hypothetical protein